MNEESFYGELSCPPAQQLKTEVILDIIGNTA